MADLDTLLAAAAPRPRRDVDVDAVLARGVTLRRRRAAGVGVATLALLGVVGAGVAQLTLAVPSVPVVGTDDVPAPAPLVDPVPVEVDATGVRFTATPDLDGLPTALPGDGVPVDGEVLAVGSDGTAVVQGPGTIARIQDPDGVPWQVDGREESWQVAAVLPDGSVLGVARPLGGDVRLTLVRPTGPGTGTATNLTVPGLVEADGVDVDPAIVVDGGRVRVFAARELDVAVVDVLLDDRELRTGPVELLPWDGWWGSPWGVDWELVGDGTRLVTATGEELLLRAGTGEWGALREGRTVHGGRHAVSLTVPLVAGDETGGSFGVVLGPRRDDVLVLPLPTDGPRSSPRALTRLHVDAAGAVWGSSARSLHLLVPAGALPQRRAGALPPAPERTTVEAAGIAVAAPGDVVPLPVVAVPGSGCTPDEAAPRACEDIGVLAVAPDGSTASATGRTLVVRDALGTSEVSGRALVGLEGAPVGLVGPDSVNTLGAPVAFDADGNLWGLADRWWAPSWFPDLVVRRPGETGFTSLGHLRVRSLLGVDVEHLVLHVQGNEVALVARVEDLEPVASSRPVGGAGRRTVVARDGVATTAVERAAEVALVPGPSLRSGGFISGLVRSDGGQAVSGPFVGADGLLGGVGSGPDPAGGGAAPQRRSVLDGGVAVVQTGFADTDVDRRLTTLAAPDGTVATLRGPDPRTVRVAADGSVWEVRGEEVVMLLDAAWRPVVP